MNNILVKTLGLTGMLIHGDTLVADRWKWIKSQLPRVKKGEKKKLLDVGCGSGAFTIGTAQLGYEALGLSWDEANQNKGIERARIMKTPVRFEVKDVRFLDDRVDLKGRFDVVICTEVIEHIINDQKLITDISNCLKKGGLLLLTTPNYNFRPMYGDAKEISDPPVEDGGHVKVGYLPHELEILCNNANLKVEDISYCSRFLSQNITSLQRRLSRMHPAVGWASILPLRPLPVLLNGKAGADEGYSICLKARKSGQVY